MNKPTIAVLCVSILLVTLVSAGSQAHTVTISWGNWGGTTDHNIHAVHMDSIAVHDTYNGIAVSWIHTAKFIEIGQRVGSTYAIEWTRFEFSDTLVRDYKLALIGHAAAQDAGLACRWTSGGIYEGQITRLDSTVASFEVDVNFWYYDNKVPLPAGCSNANLMYHRVIFLDIGEDDEFYFRIVTVNNLIFGGGGCAEGYFYDYNGAAQWTLVEENSVDSPGGDSLPSWITDDAKILNANSVPGQEQQAIMRAPGHAHNGFAVDHTAALLGIFNIASDPWSFHDRRLTEMVHDSSTTEGSSYSNTVCENLILMVEQHSDVFYNEPSWEYWGYTHYNVENL